MNLKAQLSYRLTDTRARVYLLWMVLVPLGFLATQYHQQPNINAVWVVISAIGLGYMYVVMPLRDKRMKRILWSWLVPIIIGLIISIVIFYIQGWSVLIGYLGSFWLLVMAVGYFCNGLVDEPSTWYWIAVVINAIAAMLCYRVAPLLIHQYVIAAGVTFVSMLNLWLFRSTL